MLFGIYANWCYHATEQFVPFITGSVFWFLKICGVNRNAKSAMDVFIIKFSWLVNQPGLEFRTVNSFFLYIQLQIGNKYF